uniref:Transmembrane protein 107 n=1 Tax=Onchocerca volvulus TaxID=6282 RepID=A0A8R1XUE7_ONCVO
MTWSVSSAYFLTLLAHGTMLEMAVSDMNEYVMASLPLTDWTKSEYTNMETSLMTALILGIIFCLIEIILLIFQLHTSKKIIFLMSLHLLATIFLLKFIVDSHPVYHFWIVFGVFSVPALLIAFLNVLILMRFNFKEHC